MAHETQEEMEELRLEMQERINNGQLTVKEQRGLIVIFANNLSPKVKEMADPTRTPPSREEVNALTRKEAAELGGYITRTLSALSGDIRDTFIKSYCHLFMPETLAQITTSEKLMVLDSLKHFVKKSHRLPCLQELHTEVKRLSYSTILKHIPSEDYNEGCFKLLTEAVLSTLLKAATTYFEDGTYNVKAARLFLEATGAINGSKVRTINNTQNNYLQVNNTILSQQTIEQLPPEKRLLIEGIINGDLSAPVFPEAVLVDDQNKANNATKKRKANG